MKTVPTGESITAMRLCNTCKRETAHEIRAGDGCTAYICMPCRQRSEIDEQTSEN